MLSITINATLKTWTSRVSMHRDSACNGTNKHEVLKPCTPKDTDNSFPTHTGFVPLSKTAVSFYIVEIITASLVTKSTH